MSSAFEDDQPDLFGDKGLRDEGMARVLDNQGKAWIERGLAGMQFIHRGWIGTAEEMRLLLVRDGMPEPKHHNAWGAFTKACIHAKLILWVDMGHTSTLAAHHRGAKVYLRL